MAERFSQWPERQMVTGIEVDLKEIKKIKIKQKELKNMHGRRS